MSLNSIFYHYLELEKNYSLVSIWNYYLLINKLELGFYA